MHEASLMKGLMTKLNGIAEAEGAVRVTAVNVWLGALSHMSRDHFMEHFTHAASGTLAEGAEVHAIVSEDTDDPNAQTIILQSVEVETAQP